ncbi:MAG: fibronectin type III domain-containing protein [Acidobacteriota bacterium]|nr:fibronectin type III domain-containing protein [Acidobacteriota bacterium]
MAALLSAGVAAGLAGCGTPGAPQPPSLNLPETVKNLAATRAGDTVTLAWTMPRRNTDKLLLTEPVEVVVCRGVGDAPCTHVGAPQKMEPAKDATWTETLPAALAAGPPRAMQYFVELRNERGRSAGESNAARVLAGAAPGQVTDLSGELRRHAVALHWTAENDDFAVRLIRTRMGTAKEKKQTGPLSPATQPSEVTLMVENGSRAGGALDKSAELGETYEYRAQRVAMVEVEGKTLELAGPLSQPLRVEVKDIFPPEAPKGLEAVASKSEQGELSIDLSWQANGESDLAGYVLYRREGDAAWTRISPAEPVIAPAFHDTQVLAGHTYQYAVSAVDKNGHESERSAVTEETVPNE